MDTHRITDTTADTYALVTDLSWHKGGHTSSSGTEISLEGDSVTAHAHKLDATLARILPLVNSSSITDQRPGKSTVTSAIVREKAKLIAHFTGYAVEHSGDCRDHLGFSDPPSPTELYDGAVSDFKDFTEPCLPHASSTGSHATQSIACREVSKQDVTDQGVSDHDELDRDELAQNAPNQVKTRTTYNRIAATFKRLTVPNVKQVSLYNPITSVFARAGRHPPHNDHAPPAHPEESESRPKGDQASSDLHYYLLE